MQKKVAINPKKSHPQYVNYIVEEQKLLKFRQNLLATLDEKR